MYRLKIIIILMCVMALCAQNQMYESMMKLKQGLQDLNNYKDEEIKRDNAYRRMQEVNAEIEKYKNLYNSFDKYPTIIKDGLHNVVVIINSVGGHERKVRVKNNEVVQYHEEYTSPIYIKESFEGVRNFV